MKRKNMTEEARAKTAMFYFTKTVKIRGGINMEENKNATIKDVIDIAKKRNRKINTNIITKAYEYAAEKHKDQKRKSGEPYIIHPLNVAYIVAELGLDEETICAALLHDVVEDTEATYEDISNEFGEKIAEIVEGVTKLSRVFETTEEKQAENYKKLFLAMEKDIRVILLKLADRLHNVKTLEHLKRDRQIAIAKETMDLYAPIANKLGMYDMKCELEKYAFKILEPEEYSKICEELQKRKEENIEKLEATKKVIEKELKAKKIPAIVTIETKKIYNIYKKMKEKNKTIDELKDLFSIKTIVKDRKNCYIALGLINTIYNLIPETFKDFIAVPRINMYQALHTILIGEQGVIFESQICSDDMNKISSYGRLAYLSFINKENKSKEAERTYIDNLKGIQNSLEFEKQIKNPKAFLNTLKTELFEDEVYVYTRKGDIKALPKGSTVIDFAYSISENLGNHMKGCKINSINLPLTTVLKNENIVEIIGDEKGTVPSREWLECIKTAKAKNEELKILEKNEENKQKKEVKLQIEAKYRTGIVLDITLFTNSKNISVTYLNLTKLENEKVIIELSIDIDNHLSVDEIINTLKKIEGVENVTENNN